MSYLSSGTGNRFGVDQSGLVLNVFGEYEDPDAVVVPQGVVKTFIVTNEMRAADAAASAERERLNVSPALAWREKVQLNEDNLRTVKRAASPGRQADERAIAVPLPLTPKQRQGLTSSKRPRKYCVGCKGQMSRNTKRDLCTKCRKGPVALQDGGNESSLCHAPIRLSSKTALCAKHNDGSDDGRTILYARSPEELSLDRAWSALGYEDKCLALRRDDEVLYPHLNKEVAILIEGFVR